MLTKSVVGEEARARLLYPLSDVVRYFGLVFSLEGNSPLFKVRGAHLFLVAGQSSLQHSSGSSETIDKHDDIGRFISFRNCN